MKRIIHATLFLTLFFCLFSSNVISQERYGGLTLYTLQRQMMQNPDEVIKDVAEVGYRYIEIADYRDGKIYGMTPEELKKKTNDLGMELLSAHMGMVTMDNADQLIADLKKAGIKYFVIPVPPMGYAEFNREERSLTMSEDLEGLCEVLTTLGKKCKEAGLELLYHNHNFEFVKNSKGIIPYDYFLENLDPEFVNFEIDLYWAVKGGADPLVYFEKYPGRFKIWHVKDMDEEGDFAPVGAGTIDFARMLEKKDISGMEYYIVEQDRTKNGMTPQEAIRISHKGLKDFGFN